MAELNPSCQYPTKRHLHKLVRVDLTPMVDLGFLLITFFILTTTMQQQEVIKLTVPKDSNIKMPLEASTTLTFILETHDTVGYYDGLAKEIKYANFGQMRSIIQHKQISLVSNGVNKNRLTVIIKPTSRCSYKNFIDALDEITIADCKRYFVAEPVQGEVL